MSKARRRKMQVPPILGDDMMLVRRASQGIRLNGMGRPLSRIGISVRQARPGIVGSGRGIARVDNRPASECSQ